MTPYATSLDHVLAELERIDLHLRGQVTRALQVKKAGDPFEGLYITDEEVAVLAAESTGLPRWARGLRRGRSTTVPPRRDAATAPCVAAECDRENPDDATGAAAPRSRGGRTASRRHR